MHIGIYVEYPLPFSVFNEIFTIYFRKTRKTFMKIRPLEAELFHLDRRTDRQAWRS